MNYRKAGKLRDALLVVGFVTMLAAYIWEPLFIVGALIAVSSLIPHFLFYKCPHCGKNLGRDGGDFCRFCGAFLEK